MQQSNQVSSLPVLSRRLEYWRAPGTGLVLSICMHAMNPTRWVIIAFSFLYFVARGFSPILKDPTKKRGCVNSVANSLKAGKISQQNTPGCPTSVCPRLAWNPARGGTQQTLLGTHFAVSLAQHCYGLSRVTGDSALSANPGRFRPLPGLQLRCALSAADSPAFHVCAHFPRGLQTRMMRRLHRRQKSAVAKIKSIVHVLKYPLLCLLCQ